MIIQDPEPRLIEKLKRQELFFQYLLVVFGILVVGLIFNVVITFFQVPFSSPDKIINIGRIVKWALIGFVTVWYLIKKGRK